MAHVGAGRDSRQASIEELNFVDWSAILAGAFLAAALSFVLLTFGTSIGLSATSPWPNSGLPAGIIASLALFWTMAQQIMAFMAGAYVAGRMRPQLRDASDAEVEFRDGLHGVLVWAVGIVVGVALLMATTGAVIKTGTEVAAGTTTAVGAKASTADSTVDRLLRAQTTPHPDTADARAEISRLLANAVTAGSLSNDDRTYLAQVVSRHAGISAQDAERRIDSAFSAARASADKVRKAAILTGFVTAASLLISLGAACWAAIRGGNHRDNAIPARFSWPVHRRP